MFAIQQDSEQNIRFIAGSTTLTQFYNTNGNAGTGGTGGSANYAMIYLYSSSIAINSVGWTITGYSTTPNVSPHTSFVSTGGASIQTQNVYINGINGSFPYPSSMIVVGRDFSTSGTIPSGLTSVTNFNTSLLFRYYPNNAQLPFQNTIQLGSLTQLNLGVPSYAHLPATDTIIATVFMNLSPFQGNLGLHL